MRSDLLVLLPAAAGAAAFALRAHRVRRALLVGTAAAHFGLSLAACVRPPAVAWGGWLGPDALGLLFLAISSTLFLACAVYAAGSLRREQGTEHVDPQEGLAFHDQPEAVFTGCLLLFLAALSLVCLSRHLGLLWVAVESTTLATAPMIYFHRHHRSLEAAWKYLVVCSVGIALALLGSFFVQVAYGASGTVPLVLDRLLAGPAPDTAWLRIGFVLLLVGYGTKAGLAPMHAWLPDAHSEAPSAVSALLSGALLNAALLAVLRGHQLLEGAGLGDFSRTALLALGLVSVGVAVVFIPGQPDYKRLLAYSSVEHIGLVAVAVGLGGAAVFAGLFHAVNHALVKAMLFLTAGNLLHRYRQTRVSAVRGALRAAPVTGALWLVGFLAITGAPPFGLFLSKFMILRGAFEAGAFGTAIALLAGLAAIFAGSCAIILPMVQGEPPDDVGRGPDPAWALWPPIALALGALALGLYLPGGLDGLLAEAAALIGGGP